jgi:PLP dependent protein
MHHDVIDSSLSRCEICDKVGNMSLQSIPQSVAGNVRAARTSIADSARAAGRDPDDVRLVAASKTQSDAAIRAAAAAGCTDFAENYLQEAVPKIQRLADLNLTWHFIGAVQSNKTRLIAQHFHWVHTVARVKIAERLSSQCPAGKRLNVTLQVNIDDDPDKAGVAPDEAPALLEAVAGLPNLRVRGLMTVLQQDSDASTGYHRLADLFARLASIAPAPWDTLSMGMSADFPDAIAAGATHVRLGTTLFGPRARA